MKKNLVQCECIFAHFLIFYSASCFKCLCKLANRRVFTNNCLTCNTRSACGGKHRQHVRVDCATLGNSVGVICSAQRFSANIYQTPSFGGPPRNCCRTLEEIHLHCTNLAEPLWSVTRVGALFYIINERFGMDASYMQYTVRWWCGVYDEIVKVRQMLSAHWLVIVRGFYFWVGHVHLVSKSTSNERYRPDIFLFCGLWHVDRVSFE